ncbi:MAG: hypothetical protein Q4D13_02030 [Erysipelotrichaceae bacterium]|nr:hypothetical protein [Erysipelotrichaceae bacterium]
MKKIICILLLLCIISGCTSNSSSAVDSDQKYASYIEILKNQNVFSAGSEYFDVSCELSSIQGGYRYFITIDNPKISMYDILTIAIEDGVDYSATMAACSGIFDSKYNMVPNQAKVDDGYVKGIVISGTSKKDSTVIKLYVEYKNADGSRTFSDFIEIPVEVNA